MADPVRWGVLGNARIARVCVIPAIAKSANGTVHALASRFPETAAELADRHRIAHVYGDYQTLLEDPAVDAVYIPLPNHLHHRWTQKALAAGKHVLCEKPLACDARQAYEMAAAAAQAGRHLMEAFMYRFHPRSRKIRQMVADGKIGAVRQVRSAFFYVMADDDLNNGGNARMNPKMGGGALLDVGCYGVSVARWIMNDEPVCVQAQAVYHPSGVDVLFVGILRFSGGRLATVEAGFTAALQQTYAIVGAEGAIELPHDAFIPWEKDAVFTLRSKDREQGRTFVTPGADEYRLMVEHFAGVVADQRPPMVGPEDSIANMRVLDALAEAARTGSTIDLT
jgi:xylose dehydrogenase (NAD/NADP)